MKFDSYSYAVLANHTGIELAKNCSAPGILLDKGLATSVRRSAAFPYCGLALPDDCNEGKTYGTYSWCTSGKNCKVDLANARSICPCGRLSHADCGAKINNKVYCFRCIVPKRIIWLPGGNAFRYWLPVRNLASEELSISPSAANTKAKSNVQTKESSLAKAAKASNLSTTTDASTPIAVATTKANTVQSKAAATKDTSTVAPDVGSTKIRSPKETPPKSNIKHKKKDKTRKSVDFNRTFEVKQVDNPEPMDIIDPIRYTIKVKQPSAKEDEDSMEKLVTIVKSVFDRLEGRSVSTNYSLENKYRSDTTGHVGFPHRQ